MDTQNDGLEKVTPFKPWQFLLFMLDFWGVGKYSQSHMGLTAVPFGLG